MRHPAWTPLQAERRAAPKPARASRETRFALTASAPAARRTCSFDEGLRCAT